MAKTHKATIKKAHRIAEKIQAGGKVKRGSNPYAIGMSVAKKAAAKAKRAKSRRKGR